MGFEDEMSYQALGSISELFDGNPAFNGRSAMSFAMNVAEILRATKMLAQQNVYQKQRKGGLRYESFNVWMGVSS